MIEIPHLGTWLIAVSSGPDSMALLHMCLEEKIPCAVAHVNYHVRAQAEEEERYDFVRDILVRYKDMKRIYGYKIKEYWSNIASVEDYYRTNMDFLKPEVRDYFFKTYPDVYSKIDDLPPAKYNVKKTKNVMIKDMTHTSSWRLENAEDVENVMGTLRKSLLAELTENDIVNVEF